MWTRLLFASLLAFSITIVSGDKAAEARDGVLTSNKAFKLVENKPFNPDAELERRLREQGLTPHGMLKLRGRDGAPPDTTMTENGYLRRFDRNHNGEITRSEYLSSGMRATRRLGTANTLRNRVNRLRLESRFRSADRNGDGRLTRQELGRIGDPRF